MGISIIERLLSAVGYVPQADEPYTLGTLRDQYIWQGVFFGSKAVLQFASEEFDKLINGGSVHPDIMKSILQTGAFSGDQNTFNWLLNRLEASVSEHERSNILVALGCFKDNGIIDKVCNFVLDKVPPRNQSISIAALAVNPAAKDRLWSWYTSEKEKFSRFHPLIHERVFASIVPASDQLTPEIVREFIENTHKQMNSDVVDLIIERLTVNRRLRKELQN